MKKTLTIIALLTVSIINAQAFKGKGDSNFQVGANFQNSATGINLSYDYGVGENISFGLSSTYSLNIDETLDASFGDRFDLRARFNANLGNVVNIDENFDVYPGLSLGLKNFGGHLGLRYFFSDGFGIYSEMNVPLAKYKSEVLTKAEEIHNQFSINFGATFSL